MKPWQCVIGAASWGQDRNKGCETIDPCVRWDHINTKGGGGEQGLTKICRLFGLANSTPSMSDRSRRNEKERTRGLGLKLSLYSRVHNGAQLNFDDLKEDCV
jgi:hypothetical protein